MSKIREDVTLEIDFTPSLSLRNFIRESELRFSSNRQSECNATNISLYNKTGLVSQNPCFFDESEIYLAIY